MIKDRIDALLHNIVFYNVENFDTRFQVIISLNEVLTAFCVIYSESELANRDNIDYDRTGLAFEWNDLDEEQASQVISNKNMSRLYFNYLQLGF